MLERLRQRMQPYHRFTIGAAWFFIVVSLMHLAWVGGMKMQDPAGTATLYQTSVDGEVYRGLVYDGWFGITQVLGQAGLVIAAAALSVLPWTRGRRLGLGILTVWAGWWAISLLRLAGLDGQIDSISQAGVASVLFGATGYRALCGWSSRKPTEVIAPEPDAPAVEPHLETEPEPVVEFAVATSEPDRSPGEAICCFGRAVKAKVGVAADQANRVKPVVQEKAGTVARRGRRGVACVLGKVADVASRQARRLNA